LECFHLPRVFLADTKKIKVDLSIKKSFLILNAFWIPLAYAITMVLLSPLHSVFSEWGGVLQYFSGKEILAGQGYNGWVSHFWPPLYSLLVGLASTVLDPFFAGKVISILAASGLLFVSYHLARLLADKERIGLWSQVFLATNPIFFTNAMFAHNHMLDAFCFVSSLFLFLKYYENASRYGLLIAGLVSGLAGLARYQSYVLLFMPFWLFVFQRPRPAAFGAAFFYAGFGLINMPWWYYNAMHNGSPLSSWNYLNVAVGAIPIKSDYRFQMLWRSAGMSDINGFFDVLRDFPTSYVRNFINNLASSIQLLVNYGGALALLVIPALFEIYAVLSQKQAVVLFSVMALSVALVSQAFVNPWYFLPWISLVIIMCVVFSFNYYSKLQEKYLFLKRHHLGRISFGLLIAINLIFTGVQLRRFAREETLYRPLAEAKQVARAMKSYDPHIEIKKVMAIDPGRAFYAGSKYIMTPLEYNGTVEEFVSYRGLSDRQKRFVARYPSQMPDKELKADYLVYTRPLEHPWDLQDLSQFSFLLNPESEEIPKNFRRVYLSQNVAVYEIR
jgi:hypothetical protein